MAMESETESPPPDDAPAESSSTYSHPSIDIVRVGVPFQYTIPSFAVICVTLRQIRFEGFDEDDHHPVAYDGFIKDSPSLDRSLPASIELTDWCYVPVSIVHACTVHSKNLNNDVFFITGGGILQGSYHQTPAVPHRRCFNCMGMAVVKSGASCLKILDVFTSGRK